MSVTPIIHTIQDNQLIYHYPASGPAPRGTILYLHGGGLIYGDPQDLPTPYIDLLTEAGFALWSLSYPLAPGATYEEILRQVRQGSTWLAAKRQEQGDTTPLIIFGRSAGAYLAYQVMAEDATRFAAFINLYGFDDLFAPALTTPNRYYQQFPAKPAPEPPATPEFVYVGTLAERFPWYLTARQQGHWEQVLRATPGQQQPVDWASLPPTYIAHATQDPDVPFRIAIHEKARLPHVVLNAVDADQHDFDRDGQSTAIYQAIIDWLNKTL